MKSWVFDLQANPQNNSLELHRSTTRAHPNFWSLRVNADCRIIVHKTEASLLLACVDHHDKAYASGSKSLR